MPSASLPARPGGRLLWYLVLTPVLGAVAFSLVMVVRSCAISARACANSVPGLSDLGPLMLAAYAFGLIPIVLAAVALGALELRRGPASWPLTAAIIAVAALLGAVLDIALILQGLLGVRFAPWLVEAAVAFWVSAVATALIVEAVYRGRVRP